MMSLFSWPDVDVGQTNELLFHALLSVRQNFHCPIVAKSSCLMPNLDIVRSEAQNARGVPVLAEQRFRPPCQHQTIC
jgi:hypothetical protein